MSAVARSRALTEVSVRLWVMSRELTRADVDAAELREDADELEAAARHIRGLICGWSPSRQRGESA